MPLAALVNLFKISVPQQSCTAGELLTLNGTGQKVLTIRAFAAHTPKLNIGGANPRLICRIEDLLAEAGLHCDPLTAFGAAAGKDRAAVFGLHTDAKTVGLGTAPPVGLKSALRHEK